MEEEDSVYASNHLNIAVAFLVRPQFSPLVNSALHLRDFCVTNDS